MVVLLACTLCVRAEVLVLRTGTQVKGTIVFQNDEVVVLKDASGARFQYPRTDILSISEDDKQTLDNQNNTTDSRSVSSKKVSLLVELSGGATFMPADTVGGFVCANLCVGTHNMLGKRIFLGGGVGYLGEFAGGQKYAFLPIQLVARIPLMQQKHAPLAGVSLGYGVALSKDCLGGLYAGANLGYCCQITDKSSLFVSADVLFQQAKIEVEEKIEDLSFTNHTGRAFVNLGVRMGLFF